MENDKSFFAELFDLSFSSFITMKIIKFIYIIAIIASGLFALSVIGAGFSQGAGAGFGALIVSPIIFLLHVLSARISLELVIVVFRIEKNTSPLLKESPPQQPE